VKGADLNKAARIELKTLSKDNAEEVARHLVMASRLIDEDPVAAHQHALAAGRRAGRIAIVRESVAITAYANGDFALALRELRTFRRISGSDDQIALMVDSERGIGRPDRALELGRSVPVAALSDEVRVGLAIAMSGARLDLKDADGALRELERAPIDLNRVFEWSPELYAAFATVYEELGDGPAAELWSRRADRASDVLDEAELEQDEVEVVEEARAFVDEAAENETPADEGAIDEPPIDDVPDETHSPDGPDVDDSASEAPDAEQPRGE
jgi:hypothetical protein